MILGMLSLGGLGCSPDASPPGDWTGSAPVRWATLASPSGAEPGFRMLDSTATGIRFLNTITKDEVAQNRHLLHGSGVAVGDVDGDDWPDLFVAQLSGPNHLYRNAGSGSIQFERVPGAGGAALPNEYSTGATFADVDGDEDLDLLVTTMGGPNVLYQNDGTGQFTRRANAGLHSGDGSTTAAFADVDGDADLDLYVGNYKRLAMRDSLPPDEIAWTKIVKEVSEGEYEIAEPFRSEYELEIVGTKLLRLEKAEADRLYRNDGTGRFAEVPWEEAFRTTDGTPMREAPRDWALVARLQDLNGDGHADLYVCNDFESPDHLYWGTADGTFVEADPSVLRTTSHSTMSVAATDVERDGDLDLFLADMLGRSYVRRQTQMGTRAPIPEPVGAAQKRTQEMQNTLQLNRGDGTFAEVAEMSGLEASGWTWASRFMDVDLDGYDDLLVTNGHAFDVQNADAQTRQSILRSRVRDYEEFRRLIFHYPRLDLKNVAFRNRGDGTFDAMPDGWGLGPSKDVSHGLATGDLDRDGDLDVVINRLNRSLGVYENTTPDARLAVRLVGPSPNTEAIGATVRVEAEGLPPQTAQTLIGGEYLSDSERLLSFATGSADSVQVQVQWPGGARTTHDAVPGRVYEIAAPDAASGTMAQR